MRREDLNLYLDGLLSFSNGQADDRRLLIELAEVAESYTELAADWLYFYDLDKDSALRLKTWHGMGYFQLQQVYGIQFRDVVRMIQSQRQQQLSPYPPRSEEEKADIAGLSCFMVEQQLSPWLDGEWESLSGLDRLRQHLESCENCRGRLEAYRGLHQKILGERKSVDPVSDEEWVAALESARTNRRRLLKKWLLILALTLGLIGALIWIASRGEAKMPNIYEIQGQN